MANFKCNVCGFEHDDPYVFAGHILSAHAALAKGEKPKEIYECEICGFKTDDPEVMYNHYLRYHPRELAEALEKLEKEGKIPKPKVGEKDVSGHKPDTKKDEGKHKKTGRKSKG